MIRLQRTYLLIPIFLMFIVCTILVINVIGLNDLKKLNSEFSKNNNNNNNNNSYNNNKRKKCLNRPSMRK